MAQWFDDEFGEREPEVNEEVADPRWGIDDPGRVSHHVASTQRQWIRQMLKTMGYVRVGYTDAVYEVEHVLATYEETWAGPSGRLVIQWNSPA
jgi:hypothetical protein